MKKPWLADFMYRPPSTKTILVQEPLVISQNMGWDRHFSSFFEAPIETFEKNMTILTSEPPPIQRLMDEGDQNAGQATLPDARFW